MLTPPVTTPDPLRLRDRCVLVTGGAQGIGRGIAQGVLAAGGRVAIADLDADAGRACIAEWDVAERALFVRTDVANERAVERFVQRALDAHGRIDGLVNNAGIADAHTGPLEALSPKEWHRRIDASLGGAFLCSKHALPALRDALLEAGPGTPRDIAALTATPRRPRSSPLPHRSTGTSARRRCGSSSSDCAAAAAVTASSCG